MFLYEEINVLRKNGIYATLPSFISDNLNEKFQLRPYQEEAFCNFLTFYERKEMCNQRYVHTLFHMATGSGKTLIIAGLILYLYKQGYRNFLFFVHRDSIIKKTKNNFLDASSSKYQFKNELNVDGHIVHVREVNAFEESNPDDINICFSTIQGIHSNLTEYRENSVTMDDFRERKIVFISDEAHHINADTKKGHSRESGALSWENVVQRMFKSNPENVLLEFTATCDLNDQFIKAKYVDKIIMDYTLKKFREEKYSKEIQTLRSDISLMDRAIQAVLLSQYRLKVFENERNEPLKPLILFKSPTIKISEDFEKSFHSEISKLNASKIESIKVLAMNSMNMVLVKMFKYFEEKNIKSDGLAQEIKEYFGPERCIQINSKVQAYEKQIVVNDLENPENPYRVIFAVDMLDEGWDVLNLFDIVRVKETRNGDSSKLIGAETISEAQLIGRGARYYPFDLTGEDRFKRKFDEDIENPLRVCEELYYHCQNDNRYITELRRALKESGAIASETLQRTYKLKEEFKTTDLYRNGYVFVNERILKSREESIALSPEIVSANYSYSLYSGSILGSTIMDEATIDESVTISMSHKIISISEIAKINYNIVFAALRKYPKFKFTTLKSLYPHLESMRQFIEDSDFLGSVKIKMYGVTTDFSPKDYHNACIKVFGEINDKIDIAKTLYKGSDSFYGEPFRKIFFDKTINFSDPDNYKGISQNDTRLSNELVIDLSAQDWFVFNDNYGTSEEKYFVAYFKDYVNTLKKEYNNIFLVRNERHMCVYSFEDGLRFEPDYLLFMERKSFDGLAYDHIQVFIEPKGKHLLEMDKWKEDFLCELKKRDIKGIVKIADDNTYRIWGLPFFNKEERMQEFSSAIENL